MSILTIVNCIEYLRNILKFSSNHLKAKKSLKSKNKLINLIICFSMEGVMGKLTNKEKIRINYMQWSKSASN